MDLSSTSNSTRLSLETVREIISKIDEEVDVESLEEELGTGRGDNYTSMLYRVFVKGYKKMNSGDKEAWERSFIYKVLPQSQVHREAYKSEILFRNEVAFYTHVWPALDELQREGKKVFAGVAQIYLAEPELIAMEDLKKRGYVMADRLKGLQVKQLKLVLEALAGFHALSLTLRQSRPDLFDKLSNERDQESVREALFRIENEDWYRQYYRVAVKNAIAMVSEALPKNVEERRDEIIEKLREFFREDVFFRMMCELASAKGELTVFCHGDCWTNNILFADKISPGVESVYLVDFQLIRVGSLALDLSNLLYCCTTAEIRQTHMTELLAHYHSHLVDALRTLRPNQNPPVDSEHMWQLLNDEMTRCRRFGAGVAVDMLPIVTCSSDEAPDVYEEVLSVSLSEKPRNSRPPPAGGAACAQLMTDLVLELIQSRVL